MPLRVIIIGASDLFELVADALPGAEIIGYLSPRPNTHSIYPEFTHLGGESLIDGPTHRDAAFVVAVYNSRRRDELFHAVQRAGRRVVGVVHPTSVVNRSAALGEGAILYPHAVVSTRARVARGVVVSYGALVGHDAEVGEFSFISPGVRILGEAVIGSRTLLGSNVAVLPRVRVGDDVRVAAGTVLARDVPAGITIVQQQRSRLLRLQEQGG